MDQTIQWKATEQRCTVVLFVFLYSVILFFFICGSNHAVWPLFGKILNCTVVLFVLLYSMVITFSSVDQIIEYDCSLERYWTALYLSTVCFAVALTFYSVGQIMYYEHSELYLDIVLDVEFRQRIFRLLLRLVIPFSSTLSTYPRGGL